MICDGSAVPEEGTFMSQRNTDVTGEVAGCSLLHVLNQIAGKWSIPILMAAFDGPVRFTELERSIAGISRRMLTLTLRNLERDGLIVRTSHPTGPPKVEYTASDMAGELREHLTGMVTWAERHRADIAAARRAHSVRAT
jgi:DNA-binding HxlR family transcriptional regulator